MVAYKILVHPTKWLRGILYTFYTVLNKYGGLNNKFSVPVKLENIFFPRLYLCIKSLVYLQHSTIGFILKKQNTFVLFHTKAQTGI